LCVFIHAIEGHHPILRHKRKKGGENGTHQK
jgi:hypothetical protein